ncbi:FecCD family ABC transporter permease [Castellaniella denitrificans]|uniref:FecCD family ABC transporter permease n=1 Tax=Castellaniella denitrificans TaxID=56119 RepID=UPI00360AFB4C
MRSNTSMAIWPAMSLACAAAILSAFFIGKYPMSWQDFALSFRHYWLDGGDASPNAVDRVLWQVRLPRIVAGIVVGACLSAAGAAYQNMFRNPLVSADILGISAGAGLGAMLAIFFGLPLLLIQLWAFAGGLLVVILVITAARMAQHHSPILSLVLTGIAVSSLFGGGIALVRILADPYRDLPSMTFWLMGSLNGVAMEDVRGVLPVMLAGMLPMVLLRWRMNVLSLDDEEAQALGVDVRNTRLLFIIGATLMTASAVAITGIISWIGLVIPHVARLLVGPDFRALLPASLMIGAAFLVLADTVARSAFAIEIPLGIITVGIGAPFFLSLLIRKGAQR